MKQEKAIKLREAAALLQLTPRQLRERVLAREVALKRRILVRLAGKVRPKFEVKLSVLRRWMPELFDAPAPTVEREAFREVLREQAKATAGHAEAIDKLAEHVGVVATAVRDLRRENRQPRIPR